MRMSFRLATAALCAGTALIANAGQSTADDLPAGCTTADMTAVMSGVSAALSGYLFTHPDVNDFFTGLQGLPKTEVRDRTQNYLADNPGVQADLEGIRAPARAFRARCGLPQRALILADNP